MNSHKLEEYNEYFTLRGVEYSIYISRRWFSGKKYWEAYTGAILEWNFIEEPEKYLEAPEKHHKKIFYFNSLEEAFFEDVYKLLFEKLEGILKDI